MYLKLWTAVLFVFVSFQTLGLGRRVRERDRGRGWFYDKNMKIECRFTTPLEITYIPQFDCSGNMTKDFSSICKVSVECKNHEGIRIQFPNVICKTKDNSCERINPVECFIGSASIYRNQELRNMLPEHLKYPEEGFIEENEKE